MMRNLRRTILAIASVLAAGSAGWAQEQLLGIRAASASSSSAGTDLVSFASNAPGTLTTIGTFSGLLAGHGVRTIDWRPSNGVVYAMSTNQDANNTTPTSTTAQLYTVNTATAALTAVGSPFLIAGNNLPTLEMDFNPITDEIRIVTRFAQNLRVNPNTGAVIANDTALAYVTGDPQAGNPPDITAAAHRADGTLFAWEYATDAHVRIGGVAGSPSANGGQMTTIFSPPAFLTNNGGIGMDISQTTNTLFVSHDDAATGTVQSFFTRDMATGAETLIGAFGTGNFVLDFTVVPEPGSVIAGAATVVAVGGWIRRRRQRAATATVTTV